MSKLEREDDYIEKLEQYARDSSFYARALVTSMSGDSNLGLLYCVTQMNNITDEFEKIKESYGLED